MSEELAAFDIETPDIPMPDFGEEDQLGRQRAHVGRQFGDLTLLGPKHPIVRGERTNDRLWYCSCTCGELDFYTWHYLRCAKTRPSCQFCRPKHSKHAKLPHGLGARNAVYATYRVNAKKRGIDFSLSRFEFIALTSLPCFYCGSPPSLIKRIRLGNGNCYYNGIDRMDNQLGYTAENAVPCCKKCNDWKRASSLTVFIEHARKIAEHYAKQLH